ncbi:hypothetical protein BJF93_16650 [Xaviernesmea oryzae]|uniref:DUF4174 domain-containing protein n=2 Tax=Xaviernesmea oryzae TaxID=464029 RepID=A0A1Q9ATS8_9HYPH|nr:hypothetical protein BJF93_16650 [Xaviernesmea oryzae]
MFKSLVAEVLGVGSDPVESGASLRDFEWKYRVIAIFEDDDHVQATEQARRFLADPEDLRSRDLVLLSVGRDHVRALFGAGDALSAEAIRQDLDVAPGFFGLALIGKDGTVKLLIDRLVEPSDIFERIDQMPMRQNEMRH